MSDSHRNSARSILLFETDRQLRSMHSLMLHTHGYKVESTGDEAEAHKFCESGDTDLILVGLSEPLSNVFEVCDRFRRQFPKQKIAFVPGELAQCPILYDGERLDTLHETQDFMEQIEALMDHQANAASAG